MAFEKDQVVGERNPKEIDWLKQKYIAKIETIEKAKSYPTKTSILCKWCEFLTVCSDGKAWVKNKDKNYEEDEIAPAPASGTLPASVSIMINSEVPAAEVAVVSPSIAATAATFGSAIPSHRKRTKSVSNDQLPLF